MLHIESNEEGVGRNTQGTLNSLFLTLFVLGIQNGKTRESTENPTAYPDMWISVAPLSHTRVLSQIVHVDAYDTSYSYLGLPIQQTQPMIHVINYRLLVFRSISISLSRGPS